MQGLPIFNDKLEVEAVDFTDWNEQQLGVLITPWFMNLVLLPGARDDWSELKLGTTTALELPSGEYTFSVCPPEEAGPHQSSPLFTSVVDFPDQNMAHAVAQAVMESLFIPSGEDREEPTVNDADDLVPKTFDRPVSRRKLLSRFLPREE